MTYTNFGANPGQLKMRVYLPGGVTEGPLLVLLHGCGQDAVTFAVDSGWTELADQLRFPLLLPEQMEANNAGRCFRWFQPADTSRGSGEAGSIAAMTEAALDRFGSDTRRVFIVGLSAGGAMAAALLAAYPDLFAAGACIAGLPVGAAHSGMQAIMRMASAGPEIDPAEMAARVRAAAPAGYTGPWPRLSVWQGQADTTVAPENADHLATQWRAVHALAAAPTEEQLHDGLRHRVWSSDRGPQVEEWSLPRVPHGYPVGTRAAQPARFIVPAPVDATTEIARFFELD